MNKKVNFNDANLSSKKFICEELEPRLLLSADGLGVITASSVDTLHNLVHENNEHTFIVQEYSEGSTVSGDVHKIAGNNNKIVTTRIELVIIDSRAPNFQQLHNDVIQAQQQGRDINVVILDAHRDGIQQISDAISKYNKLDAVHIVSHGKDAQLELGATQLNKQTLKQRSEEISQWKDVLTERGDVLIYGCNLAESADGAALVNSLSKITGADVAASDDLTGNSILGGDWELEYKTGDIESSLAFSTDVQENWQGTLNADAQASNEQQALSEEQDTAQQAEQQAELDAALLAEEEDTELSIQQQAEQQGSEVQEQRQELVFIDESVTDYQRFIDDLKSNSDEFVTFEIIIIDNNSDGVLQISNQLTGYDDVDAIHVFSHGKDGAIKLGNTWLQAENISDYSDSINAWGNSLDADADILIYGCNLAASAMGEQFIDQLAQLTGADVAASDDLTGVDSFGGDWKLEYNKGDIETDIAISVFAQAEYEAVFSTFIVSNINDSGAGSLRQAIIDANASAGTDTITFNIGADGSQQTINLLTALNPITDTVIIDGFSQYSALTPTTPLIELNGTNTTGSDGFRLVTGSDGSAIQGLIINNFDGDGIYIESDNNVIAGNYIGTNVAGTADAGNGAYGINIFNGASNTIGGTTDLDRNVISGNDDSGIIFYGAGATDNIVQGNYIGTNAVGTASIANNNDGISIRSSASNNTIGETTSGERNIISGNGEDGVFIGFDAFNNTVSGNYIGTDTTGTVALGNTRFGVTLYSGATGNIIGGSTTGAGNVISANGDEGVVIDGNGGSTTDNNIISGNYIGTDKNGTGNLGNVSEGVWVHSGADNNTIGGVADGAGNIIAFNNSDGIELGADAGTGNAILRNSIFSNSGLGIDINPSGVLTNDSGDGDTGANNLQNYPVLSTANISGTQTAITGSFNSQASSYYHIEFFASASGDASGNGEAETYLGYVNVATDGSGNATINVVLSATVANGAAISATATKSNISYSAFTDTSEFAANIIAVYVNDAPVSNDDPSSYSSSLLNLNPLSYWRLGEAAGTTATDLGTAGNDGIYSGAVTLGTGSALTNDTDTSVEFDGLIGHVDVGNFNVAGSGITLTAWINSDDYDLLEQRIISKASGTAIVDHTWMLSTIDVGGEERLRFRLEAGGVTDTLIASSGALTEGQWHHTTATYDAAMGVMTLYLDGVEVGSMIHSVGGAVATNAKNISIGANPDDEYRPFDGRIDEVAIFDKALTGDEIFALSLSDQANVYSVNEDNPLVVNAANGVLSNDGDLNGDSLTAVLVGDVSNGTLTLNSDGSFSYTPDADWNGTDSFTYTANDGALDSNVATVIITVDAVNDTPVANTGGPYNISEGAGITLDASVSSDVDGDALTYLWDINNDGTYGDVTGVSPTLTWAQLQTFGINDDGSYTIKVQVDDGNGGITTGTTSIVVANAVPTLTATGAATIAEGSSYTLNLSASDAGNDTITGWTINWGDGTIDTVAGNPPSVTHIYLNEGMTYNITVSATDEDGTFTDSNLLVASSVDETIYQIDGNTGQVNFTLEATALQGDASGVVVGPDGNIYTTSDTNSIIKYDGTTGALLGTFVSSSSGGLSEPFSLTFGPDGNLYVGSYNTDEVLRYSGTTGAFIDTFVTAGSGGIDGPTTLSFGPDGNLYVGGWFSNTVVQYDGQTGAFMQVVVDTGSSSEIVDFIFDSNNRFYVANTSGGSNIAIYDTTSWTQVDTITVATAPYSLSFGPDGYLYVGERSLDRVEIYDVTTKLSVGTFVDNSVGLDNVWDINFTPNHQVTITAEINLEPAGADKTVSTNEDTDYVFTVSDFGFTDTLNITEDNFLNIIIASAPTNGTLYLDANLDGIIDGGETLIATSVVSVADITAGKIKFQPAANANGAGYDFFTFQVQDDGGTANSGVDTDQSANTITIDVTAANDAPAATNLNAAESYTEDTALNLTDIVVTDIDSSNTTVTLTLSDIGAGSLSTATSGAVTSTFVGGVWTASGAIADVNVLLAGVTFNPTLNYNTNFSIATSVDDGAAPAITGTKVITAIPVNDAPVSSNSAAYTAPDSTYTFSISGFNFSDVDTADSLQQIRITGITGSGALTLSGASVSNNDVVSVADITAGNLKFTPAAGESGTNYASFNFEVHDGSTYAAASSSMTINVSGLTPSYFQRVQGGGIVVDSAGMRLDGEFSGGTLTPTLTISGVPVGATVIDAFLYVNELDFGATDTTFTLNGNNVAMTEIGSSSDPSWGANRAVTLKADVSSIITGNGSYTLGGADDIGFDDYEGVVLVVVYEDLSAASDSLITLHDGSITLRDLDNINLPLSFNSGSVLPAAHTSASTTIVTFDGQDSFGENGVSFQAISAGSATNIIPINSFDSADGGSEQFTIDITAYISQADSGATLFQQSTASSDYLVYPFVGTVIELQNAAPVANDVSTSGNEDAASVAITLTATDSDGSVDNFRLNGLPANGTLYLDAGLSVVATTGTDYTATAGSLTLYFEPNLNWNGNSTFDFVAKDNHDLLSASAATATITVNPVNDAPTATNLNAAEVYTEDSILNLIDIVVSDIDSANTTVTLTLSDIGAGALSTATSGAVTSTFVGGVWTASGAIADVNILLAGVTFNPTLNYNSNFSITTSVNDGTAPAVTSAKAFTATAVNDAPINTVPGAQVVNEDTVLVFNSTNSNLIAISDSDVGSNPLRVTLIATNGLMTLSQTTGLTFSVGSGTADATLTFEGTLTNINAALDGLSFLGDQDFNGAANIQIMTDDLTFTNLNEDSNLQGFYTFDNTGDLGNDDSVGGANDGAVNGVTATNDITRGDVLSFNGNDDVQITGLFGSPTEVTLAGWINLDLGFSDNYVISLGDSVGIIADEGSNGVSGFFYEDGGSWQSTPSNQSIAGTGWHHVAYTFSDSGNVQTLYIDGIEAGSTNFTNSPSYSQGTDSYIGRHGSAAVGYFHGEIDDARIYDRALTASEIETLTYGAPTTTDIDNIAITVNPVNDAPTATNLSVDETYTEDTLLNLIDIVVTDVDNANTTVTLTLSDVGAGNLTTATSGLVTSTFVGGVWTASGAISDVNVLLAGVTFTPTLNYDLNFSIATSVDDGVAPAITGTKAITVTPVNDVPVLDLNGAAAGIDFTTTFVEGGGAIDITAVAVSLIDIDSSSLNSIVVNLTNRFDPTSKESLSANVGATSLTAVWSSATDTLTISGVGTVADYLTVLATVQYDNTSNNPNATTRIVTFIANDGTGDSVLATTTVNFTVVNNAPTATNLNAAESYTEDTILNLIDIVVSDVDSVNTTVTLTLSDIGAGSLSTATSGLVTSTFVGGVWTASGAIADVNVLLASVTFSPALNYNSNFSIATSVNDGVAPAITGTKVMTATPVNDAPTATNLSAAENYTEDSALNLIDMVVSDVDSANVTATLTLSDIAAGSLSTGSSGSVTATFVGGVWTANGAIADVNVLLASVTFSPALNYSSNFSIATSVYDGVAPAVTGTKVFTATAVNDAPVNSVPAAQFVNEDNSLVFSTANGNLISVSDLDAASNQIKVTLRVLDSATLVFTGAGGLTPSLWTISAGTLNYDLTGTIAQINAELDGLIFTPTNNFNGVTTLRITTDDLGNVGGGSLTDIDNVSITVAAVNDPAIIGGVDTGGVTEDVDPDFDTLLETSGLLTVVDIDAGESSFTPATIAGTYGALVIDAAGNWNYSADNTQFDIQSLTTGDSLIESIAVTSFDGTTHNIVITISGVNDAPVAQNDSSPAIPTVNEGSSAILDLSANDSDIDNAIDLSSIVITTPPLNGSLIINGDGTVTYTHDGSETVSDSFNYTVSDITGAVSNVATVSLVINPVNDAPIAQNDNALTVDEGAIANFDLAANDSDADDGLDLNSINIISASTNGSLFVNGDGTVTYTHDGSETLTDSFTYTIADVSGVISNIATANIVINPVNDVPTTVGISNVTVSEDASNTNIDLNAAFNDSDNTDSELTYSIVSNTNNGLFSSTNIDIGTGQLSIGYAADENGSSQITVRATDIAGASVDTLFTVNVTPVDDVSVVDVNDGIVIADVSEKTIDTNMLNAFDVDSASSSIVYVVTDLPDNGVLLLNGVALAVNESFTQADLANGNVSYQVGFGPSGNDQFSFTVTDGSSTLSAMTFNITIGLTPIDPDEPVVPDPVDPGPLEPEVIVPVKSLKGGAILPVVNRSNIPDPVVHVSIIPASPKTYEIIDGSEWAINKEVVSYDLKSASSFEDLQAKSIQALWTALDQFSENITENMTDVELKAAVVSTSGMALTAGVVAWVLRSGALMTSLISSIPLWKGYDPMPILAKRDEDEKEKDDLDENKIPTSLDDVKKLKALKEKMKKHNQVDTMFSGSAAGK